jgi:hypothetical protein
MRHELRFPFERERWYPLAKLRAYCDEVSQRRRRDSKLSSALRLNGLQDSKVFNEELQPFRILADLRGFPDEAEFELAAPYQPAIDLRFRLEREVSIQITVADLDWGVSSNPGEVVRWQNEFLAQHSFAFGGGGTRKKNGIVSSEPHTVSSEDRINACEKGLCSALSRKMSGSKKADWLLVYARGFASQLIDDGDEIVERILFEFAQENRLYEEISVFDQTDPYSLIVNHPSR